jgi:putative hydrolase of the HAD superfamily
MPTRPALVLFDLDDVLVGYDHGVRCAALAEAIGGGTDPAVVRDVLFGRDGLESGCDRGEYGLDAYLDLLRTRHGWALDAAQFVAARAAATRVDPAMQALCDALAAQARLAMFSNNGAWIETHAPTIVPELAARFDGAGVCSGALRASKPSPDAFTACLRRLGATAHTTLFVDDKAVNAEGARLAGLDALHFTTLPTLRRDLRARGFDLPGDDPA